MDDASDKVLGQVIGVVGVRGRNVGGVAKNENKQRNPIRFMPVPRVPVILPERLGKGSDERPSSYQLGFGEPTGWQGFPEPTGSHERNFAAHEFPLKIEVRIFPLNIIRREVLCVSCFSSSEAARGLLSWPARPSFLLLSL